MATLIVNLENNFDTDQILSAISAIQGVKEVFIKPKTKTAELLERIERGEYVSDNEYFASIPGFYEELDKDFEEVMNTPPEKRIRTLGKGWDV